MRYLAASILIITCAALSVAAQPRSIDEYLCRLQLERYGIQYTAAMADSATGTDTRDLLEAFNESITDALRDNDFEVASVLLDEALTLLAPAGSTAATAAADTAPAAPAPDTMVSAAAPAKEAAWSFETAAGAEYSLYDTISSAETLPYLRFGAERSAPWAGFSTVLTADAVGRSDSTASLSLGALADRTWDRFSLTASNDLSRVHESDSLLKDYTANDATFNLGYTISAKTSLDLDSYLSTRRYIAPDSSNYDYTGYGVSAGATFIPSVPWYLAGDAGLDRRTAPLDADNDYTAYGTGIRCERYFRLSDRLSADYRLQYTAYDHPRDTAYLANDYLEQYLYAEAVVALFTRFHAELSLDAESYDYLLNTEFTPDRRGASLTPGIGCDITPYLSTGISVSLETARHTSGSSDSVWTSYARGEDYDGITGELTLDWFRTNLFFVSLSYSYQYRQYLHPDDSYYGGDSRTHSLVVFGNVSLTDHIELEISTFHDNEIQEQPVGAPDARSTLINYTGELLYRF